MKSVWRGGGILHEANLHAQKDTHKGVLQELRRSLIPLEWPGGWQHGGEASSPWCIAGLYTEKFF